MESKKSSVPVIDAIGLIDVSGPPNFKIGSWTKYEARGESLAGIKTEYEMTVSVVGEELFWGEECFWVETATAPRGETPVTLATLVSYAAFDKSLPNGQIPYFQRKTIMEQDQDGNPIQSILKRPTKAITTKDKGNRGLTRIVDTLGTEVVETRAGTFTCLKIREQVGLGANEELGDSTRYTEQRQTRTTYVTREIPVTGLARTEIEVTEYRKTWKVGKSEDVERILVDRSTLRSDLVGHGEGHEAEVVPEAVRHPIKRSTAAARSRR
jgi:hypothetical protein